jgi:hypothetical protein
MRGDIARGSVAADTLAARLEVRAGIANGTGFFVAGAGAACAPGTTAKPTIVAAVALHTPARRSRMVRGDRDIAVSQARSISRGA